MHLGLYLYLFCACPRVMEKDVTNKSFMLQEKRHKIRYSTKRITFTHSSIQLSVRYVVVVA